MTDNSEPTASPVNLDNPLALPDNESDQDAAIDSLGQALLRIMDTDPESNIVFGNIPKGEAEDFAAQVAVAEAFASPVMLRYVNLTNMAKRAERGSLLDKILQTLRAIGKSQTESRPGLFSKFRG
ncbi:MAG: hypothetical protein WDA16_14505 [Candidatus Thermoplasmatota archaeon]